MEMTGRIFVPREENAFRLSLLIQVTAKAHGPNDTIISPKYFVTADGLLEILGPSETKSVALRVSQHDHRACHSTS